MPSRGSPHGNAGGAAPGIRGSVNGPRACCANPHPRVYSRAVMKLLLLPTPQEQRVLVARLAALDASFSNCVLDDAAAHPPPSAPWCCATCGMGPILAAARTAQLLAAFSPEEVILVGLAGSYSPTLQQGSAYWFRQVGCQDLGVGEGETFVPAADLGWHTFEDAQIGIGLNASLRLETPDAAPYRLLTVCAASADPPQATKRSIAGYDAEDMESYAVAVSCHLSQIPLRVLRGISNRAGDRDHRNWSVEQALASAAQALIAETDS